MENLDYEYIADLVKKVQKGSSDAFAEIYVATYQKLYRFAYRYVKDPYLAQDILQEVYILALKNITKLENPRLFISWLNQINFRLCFNSFRKHSQYSQELEPAPGGQDVADIRDRKADPEANYAKKDFNEQLMKHILSLPPQESQAIIMKYYNEMKIEDIASVMDVSKSTVKRYLIKGRARLEQLLKSQKGGLDIE